ncbi:MAG: hypothetical protein ACE368_14430 [Paracoccaceae bacterium]
MEKRQFPTETDTPASLTEAAAPDEDTAATPASPAAAALPSETAVVPTSDAAAAEEEEVADTPASLAAAAEPPDEADTPLEEADADADPDDAATPSSLAEAAPLPLSGGAVGLGSTVGAGLLSWSSFPSGVEAGTAPTVVSVSQCVTPFATG